MSQQLLTKLKKEIKRRSALEVAADMGYRSQSTLIYWMKIGRIPRHAIATVEKYFTQKEN